MSIWSLKLSLPQGFFFAKLRRNDLNDFQSGAAAQYIITLSGEVEIETGDGTVRRFGRRCHACGRYHWPWSHHSGDRRPAAHCIMIPLK